MLKLAFASDDRTRVNQHFGAAEGFVIYNVRPDSAQLAGLGDFPPEVMDGNEGKLAAKVAFLSGCAAVFVQAIGASAIKQLLAAGIQPVRVAGSDRIEDILADVQSAMLNGDVAWVDKAMASAQRDSGRFDRMAEEEWDG